MILSLKDPRTTNTENLKIYLSQNLTRFLLDTKALELSHQEYGTHYLLNRSSNNAVKKFCSFFDKYIKKLWDDINRDINLSRDIDFASQKICLVLHTSQRSPPHPADHRWLSAYDTTEVNMALLQATERPLQHKYRKPQKRSTNHKI